MKKRYVVIVALAAVCCLSACGSKAGDVQNVTSKEAQTNAQESNEAETAALAKRDSFSETFMLSHESGIYPEEFELVMSAPEDEDIYYTLDGSDPRTSGEVYITPIHIDRGTNRENIVSAVSPSLFCTNNNKKNTDKEYYCLWNAPSNEAVDKAFSVRAISVKKNANGENIYSDEIFRTYFVGSTEEHFNGVSESTSNSGEKLAVISMTVPYESLFDYNTGIYVKGEYYDADKDSPEAKKDPRNADANYKQRGRQWEREAHIEVFYADKDGMTSALETGCGIRIQGNYSRSDLQKGFRFYARAEYGNKKFEYPLFGDEAKDKDGNTISAYKTFVARPGGNCAFLAKYNDTYWQDLARRGNVSCDTKASRPALLYINGEYFGLYVMEEDYSDNYFEDHYLVDNKDVLVYKGDAEALEIGYKLDEGKLPEGESEDYYFRELLDFFKNHDNCENDEDFEELSGLVDMDSCLDYFAVETWINNKWDWPGKNWSMWKTVNVDENNPYADGKWRFSLYDIEFGGISGSGDALTNTVKEDNYKPEGLLDMNTSNPAVLCFAYGMTNKNFRQRYALRMGELTEDLFEKEKALSLLDEYEAEYGPLYDQFFARFPESGSTKDALRGGYGSSKCISDFIEKRGEYIPEMVGYVMMR